jgi:hypothetical protein
MDAAHSPFLVHRLERQVRKRTGQRVRNLVIEMRREEIVLRGRVASFHVKQLAQHGVRDVLPYIGLANVITVEPPEEGPPGAA